MHRHLLIVIAVVLALAASGCTPHAEPGPAAQLPLAVPEAAWHFPAAIGAVANMGFADETAGDGIGGWSDQGPDNAFAAFDRARTAFAGVPFAIADPAAHGGRAIVSFRHASLPTGPAEVIAALPPGAHGRYLYLLHTACWAGSAKGALGTASVLGPDGERSAEVRLGRDVADWWNPGRVDNGAVVESRQNRSATVGVYLSRFDLGVDRPATGIRLTSSGAALWIVVGATLSARDLPLPERQRFVINAGPEWKALPADDLVVQEGTALDRSGWLDHAPAGSRGRVIARPDGALAFASDPSTPVRFFGCTGPDWVFDTPEGRDPEAFAEAVRRQGYNLVRFHFLDFALAGRPAWGRRLSAADRAAYEARAAAGQALDPAALERMDRLAAALRRRGIYLFLDAMTSWTGAYPENPWSPERSVPDLRWQMFGDPSAREHYRQVVGQLLTHRNPHTGLAFAEDPQVAVVLGFNEQELNLWRSEWTPALLPAWRAFLQRTHGDHAAWTAAWGQASAASFAEAPIFTRSELAAGGRRGRDIAAFLAEADAETQGFMEGVVRAAGYPGLFTNYDHYKDLRHQLARARLGAVAMHGYHDHPSDFTSPGSRVMQASSLPDALAWWRGIAATRIAGLPLLVTEYGHVYWNSRRHEEGLAVGAYAALQDAGILIAHASPVLLRGRPIKPFSVANDPIARASQAVTGLAWRGRAVASARHRVLLALDRATALTAPLDAISGEQSRLGLVTGLACAVEGGPAPGSADLVLPATAGGTVMTTRAESRIIDRGPDGGLAGAIAALRERGALTVGNRTAVDARIFESDTGELLLDAARGRLLVDTPTLAGISSGEAPAEAGALRLEQATTPLSATAAALDGADLAVSGRLLLVVATDARNAGEEYDDEGGRTLRRLGDGPVLVRTGRFILSLARMPGSPPLRAWALAQDGTRRDPIPLTQEAGRLRIALDTAAWACGPTPFIELAAP